MNTFFWARTSILILICCVYGFSFFGSEQPPNTGDGLIHFFISEASWSNPILFLHHWGKPIFTLLSSPFSQFGYGGIVFFNVVVFTLTVILAWKILDYYKIHKSLSILFPVVLFSIPDVYETLLSGLTEPLFNLILITSFFTLIKKRFILFAILVSLLPFCRSEGQLVILLAIPLLSYFKQYKAIPFLGLGFIAYAFLGALFLQDFFWYFNDSPYAMSNDIYGVGTWWHYFYEYEKYLGHLGLLIIILGTISFFLLVIRKKHPVKNIVLFTFGASTFIGIIAAHSYFWATGQNGSLGLTRIATQGMPLFLIIALINIGQTSFTQGKYFKLFSIGLTFVFLIVYTPINATSVNAKNLDKTIHQTARFLKSKKQRIQYYHPLFAFALKQNPFSKDGTNLVRNESILPLSEQLKTSFQPGDLIVRDSHFGREGKVFSLDAIEAQSSLVLIEEFPSDFQYQDPENGIEGTRVYQYLPDSNSRIPLTQNNKTITVNKSIIIKSDEEFIGIIDTIARTTSYFQTSITSPSSDIKLVLDLYDGQTVHYFQIDQNEPLDQNFAIGKNGHIKYYVWNPNKVNTSINNISITNNSPMKYKLWE